MRRKNWESETDLALAWYAEQPPVQEEQAPVTVWLWCEPAAGAVRGVGMTAAAAREDAVRMELRTWMADDNLEESALGWLVELLRGKAVSLSGPKSLVLKVLAEIGPEERLADVMAELRKVAA